MLNEEATPDAKPSDTVRLVRRVTQGVTSEEVNRAKAQLKASLVMNLESASARADQIARQFLAFGDVPDISTLIARIGAVETEDVTRLAGSLLKGKTPALSAVGQLSELAPHGQVAAQFA